MVQIVIRTHLSIEMEMITAIRKMKKTNSVIPENKRRWFACKPMPFYSLWHDLMSLQNHRSGKYASFDSNRYAGWHGPLLMRPVTAGHEVESEVGVCIDRFGWHEVESQAVFFLNRLRSLL